MAESACVGAEATVVTSHTPGGGAGHLVSSKNNHSNVLSSASGNATNTITSSVQIMPPSTQYVKGKF